MTAILLRGCSGRMGRMITDLAADNEQTTIVAGVDLAPAPAAYPVFGELCGCTIDADVLLDFTRADEIEDSIAYCLQSHTALLVGTTGLSGAQMDKLREASRSIPVFWASNLSMGVALLENLCRSAAGFLQDGFDVEITETHHNQKLDAPSGTALTLAEAIREELTAPAPFVHGRQGRCPRSRGEIGIHALRGGTVTGEHQVHFFGHDETITLSHSAQSRGVFAAGALRAAIWLADKPAGFYTMKDLVAESAAASHIEVLQGSVTRTKDPTCAILFQKDTEGYLAFTADETQGQKAALVTLSRPGFTAADGAKLLGVLSAHDVEPLLVQSAAGSIRLAVTPAQTRRVLELIG